MRDPVRLLDEGTSGFEGELLRSWASEQPSSKARANALAIAGVAVGVAVTGGSTALAIGTAAGANSVAGGALAPGIATTGASFAAKWLAAAMGVAAVGAAMVYVRAPAAEGLRIPAPLPAKSETTASPLVAPYSGALLEAPRVPEALLVPLATRSAPRPLATAPSMAAASRGQTSTLMNEVASLDRAHRALAEGTPRAALAQLDAYATEFPRGTLREEALVLRLEALTAAGDGAEANRVGMRFLKTFPTSPHAPRVRELLAEAAR